MPQLQLAQAYLKPQVQLATVILRHRAEGVKGGQLPKILIYNLHIGRIHSFLTDLKMMLSIEE